MKLKLRLEALTVESFSLDDRVGGRGTVVGRDSWRPGVGPDNTRGDGTQEMSCNGTCELSCNGTCESCGCPE